MRDARLLEQAGLGTRFDVLRAEGDLATANEALTRAISDQRTARRRLVQILGVGQKVELTAADPITEAGDWTMPLETSIVQAYKNRAELEQQLLQIDIYEQDRFIALSSIQPKIDFLANYNYQNNFDNSVGIVDGYSFAARVRWTFFDGGRAFAEARKADRDIDSAKPNLPNNGIKFALMWKNPITPSLQPRKILVALAPMLPVLKKPSDWRGYGSRQGWEPRRM